MQNTVVLLVTLLELCIVFTIQQQCEIAQECVTDFNENDCGPGFILEPNSHIFNCCPSCVAEPESTTTTTTLPPTDPTSSGQTTNPTSSDQTTNQPLTTTPAPAPNIPGCAAPFNCLPDGSYAAVQCKGDHFTGRCFCTDRDGNRIFGQMWKSDSSNMSCACSRRRAELQVSGRQDVTLHCTTSGDYDELQCDDGLCWCADPKTGEPIVTPQPDTNMKYLPCYEESAVGEQYLRVCESIGHAWSLIHREQSAHGTNFLGNPVTFCDYDGTYGDYQITGQVAYCTGPQADVLGSWQAQISETGTMKCYCARDTALYFPERGLSVAMTCQGNGNYQPNQLSGGHYFCVDQDGYQTTDFMEDWPADQCASYS